MPGSPAAGGHPGSLFIADTLHIAGALVTAGLGALGLLRPEAAARLVCIAPAGALGRTEVRATYGGLFAALGVFVLVSPDPGARVAAGAAWLGAAGGRLLGAARDTRAPRVFGAAIFEGGIAILLLYPG